MFGKDYIGVANRPLDSFVWQKYHSGMPMKTTNREFEGINLRVVIVKDKTPFERMTENTKNKPFKNLERPVEDIGF